MRAYSARSAVRAVLAVHAVRAASAVQRSANALRAVSYQCMHRALRAVRVSCEWSQCCGVAWRGVAWRAVVVPSARVVLLTLQMPNEPLIIEAFPMAQTAER